MASNPRLRTSMPGRRRASPRQLQSAMQAGVDPRAAAAAGAAMANPVPDMQAPMAAPMQAASASPQMAMKNGGSASSRADGIAQRGKTKGTMC
jgi:hypothetical protein